jgi:hypothetical protein
MKSRAWIPVAAVALAMMSTPTLAQDTVVSKGAVARPPTFEGLMGAIGKTAATIETLLARQTIAEADVVPVDTKPLIVGQGDELLRIQMERHEAHIKQLREILSKHAGVAARLKKESADPSISEVIAAEIQDDGKIQLYYRKS